MRELKFRAWNMTAKRMIYDIQQEPADSSQYSFANYLEDKNNNVVMQFTGLLDRNGKEIYEGDIVRGDQQNTAIVEWSDDSRTDHDTGYANGFSIDLEDTYVRVLVSGYDFQHQLLNVEIIGNIYESPNLIEVK